MILTLVKRNLLKKVRALKLKFIYAFDKDKVQETAFGAVSSPAAAGAAPPAEAPPAGVSQRGKFRKNTYIIRFRQSPNLFQFVTRFFTQNSRVSNHKVNFKVWTESTHFIHKCKSN